MNTDSKPKIVRVVIFVTLSLLILLTLYLLVNRVDFSGQKTLRVKFDYIGSIQVGSPVRKSGVKIGSVRSIEIDPVDQKTVYVTLSLYPGQIVRTSDHVSIVSGGILGDQYIEIFPGEVSAPVLPSGATVKGSQAFNLQGLETKGAAILTDVSSSTKMLSEFLTQNQEKLGHIVTNVDTITTNLAKLSSSMEDVQVTLHNLREITDSTKDITSALDGPNGLVSLLKKPQTTQAISQTLGNIRSLSENLKQISDELKASLR
ncbi:MAG: MCE family protein [Spirochaetales bacterium]|nr:MCE family protein [Spirochaetales bacterium]